MKFFKIFLAALLACLACGVISSILWLIVILSTAGIFGSQNTVKVLPNSILKITFEENFSEAPLSDPFAQIDFTTLEVRPSLTLLSTITAIEAAAYDPNIEGIYLSPSANSTIGGAALEEIRSALIEFKKSGKFIIAYNETYSQGGYYLATAADKIYVQPEGMIQWQGMAVSTPFYKGLLDKLNITIDVFRPTSCRYKSAVEPFIMNKMSKENRAQMEQITSSMWGAIASEVALARALPLEDVNRIADELICFDVDDALKERMVDALIYEDQLPQLFREAGADISESDKDVNYIDFGSYASLHGSHAKISSNKIAIVYAEGTIYDGEGTDNNVYSDNLTATIRKARNDKDIKVVILRVNSPGGSALASDVIWRELELLRAEKPLIVSMGSYAASGGYYISAPADAILANKMTLTGSIGVFSIVPNIERALQTKLGITFDTVKTNSSAGFMTSLNGMNEFEKLTMQKGVDKVYEQFTSVVSEGRNLPLDDVLEIAQGRVWSGTDAVELGLADSIGGLHDAIAQAIATAGLDDDYRVVEMVETPTGIAALFSGIQATVKSIISSEMDPIVEEFQQIHEALRPITSEQSLIMYSPYRVNL